MNESKSDLRLALDAWRRLVVECDMKEKPVAKSEKTQHATYRAVKTYHGGKPWYVQEPPKREWQGLTDEEIALIVAECSASAHSHDDFSFARAIEAKLKEKNNG